jgi:SpoIIAA-like
MIEKISPMPDGTIGFRASGRVTAEDYRGVLEPALREAVGRQQPINLLYQLADDVDYTSGAALQDLKTGAAIGLPHLSSWHRTAVVSDAEWIERTVQGVGWMMPGEVRSFHGNEIEDAKTWLAS